MDLLLVLILLLLLFGGGGGLYWGFGAGWGLGPIGLLVLVVVVVYLLYGYRGRRGPPLEKNTPPDTDSRGGHDLCQAASDFESMSVLRLLQRPCQVQWRTPQPENRDLHARERRA
jgi:hypothetical protein